MKEIITNKKIQNDIILLEQLKNTKIKLLKAYTLSEISPLNKSIKTAKLKLITEDSILPRGKPTRHFKE